MVRVPRDAARLGLALDDDDIARGEPAQLDRRRETGWPTAEDDDGHEPVASSLAASSAPQ